MCRDCLNVVQFTSLVSETRQHILDRSPNAFAPKASAPGGFHQQSPSAWTRMIVQGKLCSLRRLDNWVQVSSDGGHKKGCHCKKSRCLKKYCECYQANVPCTESCRYALRVQPCCAAATVHS